MAISTYLSIIMLNANKLNATDWILKDPSMCYLQETHFRTKDAHRLKVRGWKKIYQTR